MSFKIGLFSITAATLALSMTAPSARASAIDPDEVVYPAYAELGETSLEFRQGRHFGKTLGGQAGGVVELEHNFSDLYTGSILAAWSKAPGESAKVEAISSENIFYLGVIPKLDIETAGYVEYQQGIRGQAGGVEAKALFTKRSEAFEARLNLIYERWFSAHGARNDWSYAASVDFPVRPALRLGAEAFGEIEQDGTWGGRTTHLVGPVAKYTLNGVPHVGVKFEAAYLFPVGTASRDTNGQVRLMVELEKRW
jgi:hypothetical protein